MLNTVKYPQGQSAFGGKTILLTIVLCILSVQISQAQWQPDVRLTNNSETSNTSVNNARCIAARLQTVHIVWFDDRDGNTEIYYKRSTDEGVSWGADTRLTNNASSSKYPSVTTSVVLNFVHVVWEDERDGNLEIYYKLSTNGGLSWGADERLTNNSAVSQFSSVSVSGFTVHLVWQDTRDGNAEIYYRRSINSGNAWGPETRLTNNSASSQFSSASVSGLAVHVVWNDTRDGATEIYYKRSPDDGISWGADIRMTNNSAFSEYPSISVAGSFAHVVWEDNRDGNYEIYYKGSTNGGVSWGADTRLTNNSGLSLGSSVSESGSAAVHVVWYDNRDGNKEIYYKRSPDEGLSWGADTRLTNAVFHSEYPSLILYDKVVHLVWQDSREGNYEIYYKRDPTGNPIGITPISSEISNRYSLSQNYPNPFNPTTNIRFTIPKSGFVKLTVFDMLGREIETLVNENLTAGTYNADWSAEGGAAKYSSGVYFYKLISIDYSETKRMVLIK